MSKNVAYNANLNGFTPYERYYFEFKGLGGNWPAIISPASGYFTTDSDGSYDLYANVSFCISTGSVDCNPASDGYLVFNENTLIDSDLFTTIQLDVKNLSNIEVLSQTKNIPCPDCRPTLSIHSPQFVNLIKSNNAQADFNIHIDGLEIGENYNYEIKSLFGNWPMYVTPTGGTFKSYEQTKTLTFTADVCESGNGCSSENLLLEYDLDDRDTYYSGFKFILRDSNQVEDSSSVIEAICENCLPESPQILTTQNQILTSSIGDTSVRNVEILNLNQSQTYYYVIENIITDSDIVIYPQSGTISNKTQHIFELDTVFCSSSECSSSTHYVAPNSQGSNYFGSQAHDVNFDIKLYRTLNGSVYSDLVASIDNVKTTCDRCVKVPEVSLNNNAENIVLRDSNTLSIVGNVGNLDVGKKYRYYISNESNSWPVEIMRPSGEFTARSANKVISSSIKFCEASGICNDAIFDVNDIDYDYKHIVLNMTIETLNSSIEDAISDSLSVLCDNCIEDHRIGNLSNNLYPEKYVVEIINTRTDRYDFNIRFDNLVIGQSYTYTINPINSNWPVHIDEQSKTFTAERSTVSFPNRISFCPTSNGECSRDGFTISEIGDLSTKFNDIYFYMNIGLQSAAVDVDIESHNIEINCNNCINNVSFSQISSNLSELSNPNNDNPLGEINATIDGLEPNSEYYYIINSGSMGTWPFVISNLSGYFTPVTDTYDLSVLYEVVANTGVNAYDISHTMPYSYSPSDLLKFKDISITIGSYESDIRGATSNITRLFCDNCFDDPNTNKLSLSCNQGTMIEAQDVLNLDFNIANSVPGYKYGYRITSIDSNWPYQIDIPVTGFFEVLDNTTALLPIEISFCATSGGSCFTNRFNTDISTSNDIANNYDDIVNKLRIQVSGLEGEPLITNTSHEDITLMCDTPEHACIRNLNTSIARRSELVFDVQPLSSVNNINNIEKHNFYYQVNGSDLNWPINLENASGYVRGDEGISLVFRPCPTVDGECSSNSPFDFVESSCVDNLDKSGTFDIYYSGVDIDISPVNSDDFDIVVNESQLDRISVNSVINTFDPLVLNSDNGPSVNISYNVSNLYYNEEYGYRFIVNNSNWPLELSIHSGTFVANSLTETLSTTLTLCNNADGSCANDVNTSNLINYTLNDLDPELEIVLHVSGINCDIADGRSNTLKVQCDQCLETIDFADIGDQTLTSDRLNLLIDLSDSVNFDVSQSYYYEIHLHESNWPINVNNISGTVSNTNFLSPSFVFCPTSSGDCSLHSNTFGVNSTDCGIDNTDKYGVFDIMVSGSGLDIDTKTSNKFRLTCPVEELDTINVVPNLSLVNLTPETTNRFNFNYNVTDLTKDNTYRYSINSFDANWPLRILPAPTGIFTAKNNQHTIKLLAEFCANSGGTCANSALDYTANESCLLPLDQIYQAGLEIKVWKDGSSGCEVADGYDNSLYITCDDCLGNVNITQPANTSITNTNVYLLGYDITGLKNGQSYTYTLSCDDANWPVSVTPLSGTFEAEGTFATIQSSLQFCYPSGICADKDNVFDYSEFTYYDKITKGTDLYSNIKLTITPNGDCEELEYTSKSTNIICSDCLPAFSYASILMSGSPEISLPESCCTGNVPVYVNVSNAIPGESYTYNFSASSQDISFSPSSGVSYFDGTGNGTIITTVNSSLDLYGMSIIQCELTHDNTNEKVIDMISMRCGESCPVS